MDKINLKPTFLDFAKRKIENLIWNEPAPFSSTRSLNKKGLSIISGFGLFAFLVTVLILPSPPTATDDFSVRKQASSVDYHQASKTEEFKDPMVDYAFGLAESTPSRATGSSNQGNKNNNTPMILARSGDSLNGLPPGTRFQVKIQNTLSIGGSATPVIAKALADILSDDGSLAIPAQTSFFGEASFEQNSERAQISWKTLRNPDGVTKSIAGVSVGEDGQPGVTGKIHSDGWKNLAGQMITRFGSAMAEGAMTRNQTGESAGGIKNGLLNGLGETGHEQSDAFADDLKKKRSWIEIPADTSVDVVLTDFFVFRDPGSIH